MSDFVSSPPPSQRAAERSNASDAKSDTAPLKAFESALLNVKASAAATSPATPAVASAVTNPAVTTVRSPERSGQSAASRDGGKSVTHSDDGGPRPAASATTTAIAGGVQGSVASESSAKAAQKTKGQSSTADKSKTEKAETGKKSSGASPDTGTSASSHQTDDALAPTIALSHALSEGGTPDVKVALQSTLQGFADGSVPDAIKASLSRSGTPASAEITDLLDNITVIAQDILDKGPLSDLDMANLDELFWVSNWFDLFNQSATYDPNNTISNSVSSAMAMPMDLFYTRALLRPLVDTERAAAPGIVNRRAVRANTEATPGAESVRNRSSQ
jgi:hypothetical protein